LPVATLAGKTAAPAATPAPTPIATPAPEACLYHDISPAVAATADPASFAIPAQARASKVSGTAQIQVQIDPQGAVTAATVAQSSGNTGLDDIAVQMAKSATYKPALVKCKPIASTYTFSVHFVAW
jgi:TonB family protein